MGHTSTTRPRKWEPLINFSLIVFDECGDADLALYDRLRAALRPPPEIPGRVVYLGNPGGRSHGVLLKRFAHATPGVPSLDPVTGRRFVLMTSTIADNPHLNREDFKSQLRAACAGDPELLKAWLHGDWHINKGGYFVSVLDEQRVMLEPWSSWPEPTRRPWHEFRPVLSLDWGSSAPAVAYLGAISPGAEAFGRYISRDSVVLVDELSTHLGDDYNVGAGYTVPMVADRIRDLTARWGLKHPPVCAADDACFAKTGSAAGSIAAEFQRCGIGMRPARKLGRVHGWSTMRTMLSRAGALDEPALYVSRLCKGWWATVPHLQRDLRNPEDIDSRGPDHWGDSCLYMLTSQSGGVTLVSLSGVPG